MERYCKNNKLKNIIATILFLALICLFPIVVKAMDNGVSGRPAFPDPNNTRTSSIFIHTLETGSTQNEGVQVVNNSNVQKTILVYAADYLPSSDGGFACKQLTESKLDVGAWIIINKAELTLQPGKDELIPFTIKVPTNAGVGEHNGCILIQEKEFQDEEQTGMSLSFRSGIRVAITIPGTLIRKLELKDFKVNQETDGNFTLIPQVKNTGNVSIDTNINVVTKYLWGTELAIDGGQYPILRDESSNWNFKLEKPFWGGWYYSSFSLSYDENSNAGVGINSGKNPTKLESPSIWFFSQPTPLALVIEIAFALLILTTGFLYRRSKRNQESISKDWINYEIKPRDTIQELARQRKVSWKLIAKVNKLKPPFTLIYGEIIKIPPYNKLFKISYERNS